jgi:ATP-dependent DNA helicase RecQ
MSGLVDDSFRDAALGHLQRLTGDPSAEFRDQQLEVIHRLVEERQRVLLVQRTGWGKSAVYFIATRMLRDRGAGPTLLVSPLLALMRNQIEAATRMGVRATTINSANTDEWPDVLASLSAGEVDVLLISPERLANPDFREDVLPEVGRQSGLLVVDEVHCVSDWGHDFRPNYQRIRRVLELLPAGVPIIGCTATANDRVIHDVNKQFATDASVRGPLGREGLRLHVLDLPPPAARLAWLSETIPRLGGTGIVYTLTIADAERVAEWLRSQGLDALAYHGSLDPELRIAAEQRLLANDVDVVVATSALGMGFDHPALHFVIHYQAPAYPISYYQQVGRAGRQLVKSWGILLRGTEDEDIQNFFIENAFPPPELAKALVTFLEESGESFTAAGLEEHFNVRRHRLTHLLQTLAVESAVERDGYRWRRTLTPWSYDLDRAERVTTLRRVEQEEMRVYAATGECRMTHLLNLLDDPVDAACGICDRCTGESLAVEPDQRLVAAAVEHLRGGCSPIEQRRRWPTGGRIPPERRCEEGRALSRWGDGGWGDRVPENRTAGRFDDDILDAATDLILNRWCSDPLPPWVTDIRCDHPTGSTSDPLATLKGMTVVVTGRLDRYSRTEAREAVVDRGGRSTEDVSVVTSVLVAGERPGSKLAKAETYGVPVIDEADFDQLLATGQLPDAAVELIKTRWRRPDPFPTWVTVVPSVRYPGLTADFAARLAERLGLRFIHVVERAADRNPQRNMQNSAMQFQNVDQAFTVGSSIDEGPVLLVDDVVNSRWTMTVIGALLREAGSGPVFPFTLADTAGRSA